MDTNLGLKGIINDSIINLDLFLLNTTESLDTAFLIRVHGLSVVEAVIVRSALIETVVGRFELGSRLELFEISI